ncbi:hypothetical protein ACLB1R_15475 [Escherichia coli]
MLAAYRFLIDSRDTETDSRLDGLKPWIQRIPLSQHHELRQCMSEGLNPTRAIGHIKSMLLQRNA